MMITQNFWQWIWRKNDPVKKYVLPGQTLMLHHVAVEPQVLHLWHSLNVEIQWAMATAKAARPERMGAPAPTAPFLPLHRAFQVSGGAGSEPKTSALHKLGTLQSRTLQSRTLQSRTLQSSTRQSSTRQSSTLQSSAQQSSMLQSTWLQSTWLQSSLVQSSLLQLNQPFYKLFKVKSGLDTGVLMQDAHEHKKPKPMSTQAGTIVARVTRGVPKAAVGVLTSKVLVPTTIGMPQGTTDTFKANSIHNIGGRPLNNVSPGESSSPVPIVFAHTPSAVPSTESGVSSTPSGVSQTTDPSQGTTFLAKQQDTKIYGKVAPISGEAVDLSRLAEQVYQVLEVKIAREKERRGM